MISKRYSILAVILLLPLSIQCSKRNSLPETEDGKALPLTTDTTEVDQTRDPAAEAEMDRLNAEKLASEAKASELEKTLADIQSKMQGGLTEAERAEYLAQIDRIQKELAQAEAQRKKLEEDAKKAAAASRRFVIVYDKPDPSAKDDCIALNGDAQIDGTLVKVAPCTYLEPQQFRLEYNGSTVNFRLISKPSGKCLGVLNNVKDVDAAFVLQACGSDPASPLQNFTKEDMGGSLYKIKHINSQLCMKIAVDGVVKQNTCSQLFSPFRINMIEGG